MTIIPIRVCIYNNTSRVKCIQFESYQNHSLANVINYNKRWGREQLESGVLLRLPMHFGVNCTSTLRACILSSWSHSTPTLVNYMPERDKFRTCNAEPFAVFASFMLFVFCMPRAYYVKPPTASECGQVYLQCSRSKSNKVVISVLQVATCGLVHLNHIACVCVSVCV